MTFCGATDGVGSEGCGWVGAIDAGSAGGAVAASDAISKVPPGSSARDNVRTGVRGESGGRSGEFSADGRVEEVEARQLVEVCDAS